MENYIIEKVKFANSLKRLKLLLKNRKNPIVKISFDSGKLKMSCFEIYSIDDCIGKEPFEVCLSLKTLFLFLKSNFKPDFIFRIETTKFCSDSFCVPLEDKLKYR